MSFIPFSIVQLLWNVDFRHNLRIQDLYLGSLKPSLIHVNSQFQLFHWINFRLERDSDDSYLNAAWYQFIIQFHGSFLPKVRPFYKNENTSSEYVKRSNFTKVWLYQLMTNVTTGLTNNLLRDEWTVSTTSVGNRNEKFEEILFFILFSFIGSFVFC